METGPFSVEFDYTVKKIRNCNSCTLKVYKRLQRYKGLDNKTF